MLQFSRKQSQFAKFAKYRGVEKNHLYSNSLFLLIELKYYVCMYIVYKCFDVTATACIGINPP